MNTLELIIKHVPMAMATSMLSYAVGHLLLANKQRRQAELGSRVFFKTIVGYSSLLVLYAVFQAKGNTVLLGALPLLLSCSTGLRNRPGNEYEISAHSRSYIPEKDEIKWLFALLLCVVAIVVFPLAKYQRMFSGGDYHYYAGLADSLNRFGIESPACPNGFASHYSIGYYHFGDIWGAALLARLFNIPSLTAYVFVMIPFLMGLMFYGLYCWSSRYLSLWRKWTRFLLVGVVFLLCMRTVFDIPKLAVVGVFLVWSILEFNRDDRFAVRFLPVFVLGFIYTSVLPTIICGAMTVLFVQQMFNIRDKRAIIKDAIIPVYMALFAVCFYGVNILLNPASNHSPLLFLEQTLHSHFATPGNIVGSVIWCCAMFASLCLFSAGCLFGLGCVAREVRGLTFLQKYNEELLFITGVILSGYIASGVNPFSPNTPQVVWNLMRPLVDILSVCLIVWFICHKRFVIAFAVLLPSLCINATITNCFVMESEKLSKSYRESLQVLDKELKGQQYTSAYIQNPITTESLMILSGYMIVPFSAIRQFSASYFPEWLSCFDVEVKASEPGRITKFIKNSEVFGSQFIRKYRDDFLAQSDFARYVKKRGLENDIVGAQTQYILSHRIDYVFVQDGNRFLVDMRDLVVEKKLKLCRNNFFDEGREEVWWLLKLSHVH